MIKEKERHSKLNNIEYKEFKMQNYFVDNRVESWVAKNIFKFRTRMTEVKENFKNNYKNESVCPLCKDPSQKDDQSHLLKCPKLKENGHIKRNYFDIFSEDILKIYETIIILIKAMETRQKLLDEK